MIKTSAERARKLLRDRRFTSFLGLFGIAFAAAAISVYIVSSFSVLSNLDDYVHDWEVSHLSHERPSDPRIVVVAINEDTLKQFPYRSPIDRGFLATLLNRLDSAHPKAIAIDVLFDQPTEPAKDRAMEDAIHNAKSPLVIAYTEEAVNVTPRQLAYLRAYVPPKMRFIPDLPHDGSGITRNIYPGIRESDGHYYMSFERALAEDYGVRTADDSVTIRWPKAPKDQIYDFFEIPSQVINAYPTPMFNMLGPALLKDKIVIVGSDLTLIDRHRTPLTAASDIGVMPGVLIHAYGVSTLLDGGGSPFASWKINLILALALAFSGGALGMLNFQLLARLGILAVIIVGYWVLGAVGFYESGTMVGLLSPSLAMIGSFAAMDSLTGREARKQRQFIQGAFSRYVSHKVVEQLVADPEKLKLEGERRVMTFLFTDIAGFTSISEFMEGKELATMLNSYLEGMTSVVLKHEGMVDKFIGDSVFAIFNAPVDLEDHAHKAVQCALEMDDFAEKFRMAQNAKGIEMGVTRIGVHTGPAVVGNFGSQAHLNYTASGDAVNTASRLEGLNKTFHTRMCVSDDTRVLCPNIPFREIASVVLKGRTQPTMVWEPLHTGKHEAELTSRYRAAFAKLKDGDPQAQDLFEGLAKDSPDDTCVAWHVARLRAGEHGVEAVMTEK